MDKNSIVPESYKSILDLKETEKAIKLIKDFFQINLAKELSLRRVTAPLFVRGGTGINDDLSGTEKPISFEIKADRSSNLEIVQALTKWKRMKLADYGFKHGEGLYTDMNAVRPDEKMDNMHSIYVDQWDWERIISKEERSLEFLKYIVKKIYKVMRKTERFICKKYPAFKPVLPKKISFIHAEELLEKYPDISPSEREDKILKEKRAVFLIGIGGALKDGKPHDSRASDYDDWITSTGTNTKGLNGDILVWCPVLQHAFEISSMGVRVDKEALLKQLELTDQMHKTKLLYHSRLLKGELPLTIGGGIGQSRLCMFFLQKAHIGEIQASVWPEEMMRECKKKNVILL